MEGDPFAGEGLEYLFGIVENAGGEPSYHTFWGHDEVGEKRAFEATIDFFMARLARDPNLHIYHYGQYEETRLKRIMGRHATRETEMDKLLRGEVLVDLHRVVKHSLLVSQPSYSLKKLEPLYMEERDGLVQDAASSIVEYERF